MQIIRKERSAKQKKNQIIDKAVTEVVAKQKELGFHVITRRRVQKNLLASGFYVGFEGVGHEQTGKGDSLMESWHHLKILI